VVPTLADWCALDLVEPGGGLQRVALADLHGRETPDFATEEGLAGVLSSGESLLVSGVTDGVRSGMLVPLQVLERTIGVLTLVNSDSQRSFSTSDLAFAEQLGLRVATAVHNARLYRDRRGG